MSNSAGGSARWWIARPGQQPEGPFAIEVVVDRLRSGDGPQGWMACPEGGTEWVPASSIGVIAETLSPKLPATAQSEDPKPAVSSPAGQDAASDVAAPPPPAPASGSKEPPNNTLLVLIHAGVFVPVIGFAVPLIIWLTNRDKPGVEEHGKEVTNWVIFLVIASIASVLLACCAIGLCLIPVLAIGQIVFAVLGAIKASKGELMRYPMPFRLLK